MKGRADLVYVSDDHHVATFDFKPIGTDMMYVAVEGDTERHQLARILKRTYGQSVIVYGDPDQIPPIIVVPHHGSRTKAASRYVPERRVALPPGVQLSTVAQAVLTPRAFRRHVMVAVGEMQAEHIEEIRAGNYRKARWVSIRGHALIILTLLGTLLPARIRAFLSG